MLAPRLPPSAARPRSTGAAAQARVSSPDSPDPPASFESSDAFAGEPEPLGFDAYRPEPGVAPSNGAGLITAGAITIPLSLGFGFALTGGQPSREEQVGVWTTAGAVSLVGATLIGLGIRSNVQLRRWARIHRVIPTAQGNGPMAAGAISLNIGLVLVLGGALARDLTAEARGALIGSGLGTAAGISLPLLLIGRHLRRRYARTGGWVRPELPLAMMTPMIGPQGSLGAAATGRF